MSTNATPRARRWARWQHLCGWLAVAVATIWAVKFTLLTSTAGRPSDLIAAFTGFLAPTVGSLLGLVAAFGAAAPLVTRRPWWIAIPLVAAVGLATVFVFSTVSNATAQLPFVAGSTSPVLRAEAPIVTTALLYGVLAVWLLRPRVDSPATALVLTIGGVAWLIKGAAVAGGAPVSGWAIAMYQAGLWALLVAAVWLVMRELRHRHYARIAAGMSVVVAAQLTGAVAILSGELGVLVTGSLALVLGVALWRRDRGPGAAPLSALG